MDKTVEYAVGIQYEFCLRVLSRNKTLVRLAVCVAFLDHSIVKKGRRGPITFLRKRESLTCRQRVRHCVELPLPSNRLHKLLCIYYEIIDDRLIFT